MRLRVPAGVAFYALAALCALPFAPARWLPMVDLPQHELVADALVRHLRGSALPSVDANYFTYNAGFEAAVALLSPLCDVIHASRITLALTAFGLVAALGRFRSLLGLERWPALLASLLFLHYSASWGFANFTLGVTLLFVVLGDALALRSCAPTAGTLARMLATALALAVTHVLATLAACVGFALLAAPSWLRRPSRSSLVAWTRAAGPLLVAAAYDVAAFLWARAHPHAPWENAWAEGRHRGVRSRLQELASNTLGTHAGPMDTITLVVLVLALVMLAASSGRVAPHATRDTTTHDDTLVTAALPLGFALLYLVVPTVFIATFYVGERFASLAFLAAIAVVPAPRERRLPHAIVAALALTSTVRLEQTIRASNDAARDGLAVLDAIPPDSTVLPVNRSIDVEGFARSPLRHLFAHHALRAGAAVGYSFLRFESPPVRRKLPTVLPDPPGGLEGDGSRLDATAAWARAWDVLFVVDEHLESADDAALRKVIAPSCADDLVLIARRGRFAAYRWDKRRTVVTM